MKHGVLQCKGRSWDLVVSTFDAADALHTVFHKQTQESRVACAILEPFAYRHGTSGGVHCRTIHACEHLAAVRYLSFDARPV